MSFETHRKKIKAVKVRAIAIEVAAMRRKEASSLP